MRTTLSCLPVLALAGLLGCSSTASYVHSPTTTLGRVVIYRNGVAYFERTAHVAGPSLKLAVPADKIDDFLKSLTVVDAKTGLPAPVSYPTHPGATTSGTGLVDMSIELPGGRGAHDVRLSYVTEAPAWKPSYRVVLGGGDKIDLEGWAIVDNTSGEDWKDVRLGVGASSALSFRFDLRSVRVVERETLNPTDLFALAPPTGQTTYGGPPATAKKVLGELDDGVLHREEDEKLAAGEPNAGGGFAASGYGVGSATPATAASAAPARVAPLPKAARMGRPDPVASLARRLRGESGTVTIEGYAAPGDEDKQAASLERASRLRDELVAQGVDAGRLVAVGRGERPGRAGGARVVESDGPAAASSPPAPPAQPAASSQAPLDPIGTSHFESAEAMTVPRGTSAMISILHAPAEGQVVYLYDPESARGNAQFAFRSLRLRNPTDSQLESGPVTVFGDGRFVGEGLSEPIPAHQVAFVPFALDRQIVVDRDDGVRDEIARIITVNRGVFQTQVQHVRRTTLVLHNRLPTKTVIYVRHTVAPGYHTSPTSSAPPNPEHVAGADLYRVEVDGLGKKEVVLEESTPVFRTADLRTPDGMSLVRTYLSSAVVAGPLKGQVEELMKTQKEIGDDEQRIATQREQMGEYRERMDELHAQIVTLRMVRTGGPLMASLEKKLQDVSDKLSKATIDVVALEEKLMLARIKFQDGVADLSLDAQPPTPRLDAISLASPRPAGGGT